MNQASFHQPARTINPAEFNELHYWSVKWGVSIRELRNAILDTGKTDVRTLRSHLMKNKKTSFILRSMMGTLLVQFIKPGTSTV